MKQVINNNTKGKSKDTILLDLAQLHKVALNLRNKFVALSTIGCQLSEEVEEIYNIDSKRIKSHSKVPPKGIRPNKNYTIASF